MNKDIQAFNRKQSTSDKKICNALTKLIDANLPKAESKIWHSHPVWFIDGNPIVGYGKLKDCVRLMFWSGADFKEKDLQRGTGKFKDASIRYSSVREINERDVRRLLKKAAVIQWDYKNVQKRRGKLKRIKKTSGLKKKPAIYTMSFASVYPHYVAKAEKKGRTKKEVDEIIKWLTGYSQKELNATLKKGTDFETFFKEAPEINPTRKLITGVVCGIRVEEIKEPTMREIRYLDKLIDELAKGKAMEKIVRE